MPKKPITLKMLARDVLKYLDPKRRGKIRLKPKLANAYVNLTAYNRCYDREVWVDLQEYALSGKQCEVCGLGALLVAKAIREDKISVNAYDGAQRPTNTNELLPMSVDNYNLMAKIEDAFEHWRDMPGNPPRSARTRLKSVCRAIIAGKFS